MKNIIAISLIIAFLLPVLVYADNNNIKSAESASKRNIFDDMRGFSAKINFFVSSKIPQSMKNTLPMIKENFIFAARQANEIIIKAVEFLKEKERALDKTISLSDKIFKGIKYLEGVFY